MTTTVNLTDVLRSDKKVKKFFNHVINRIHSVTVSTQEIVVMENCYEPAEIYRKLSPIEYNNDLYEFREALNEINQCGDFEYVSNEIIREWLKDNKHKFITNNKQTKNEPLK